MAFHCLDVYLSIPLVCSLSVSLIYYCCWTLSDNMSISLSNMLLNRIWQCHRFSGWSQPYLTRIKTLCGAAEPFGSEPLLTKYYWSFSDTSLIIFSHDLFPNLVWLSITGTFSDDLLVILFLTTYQWALSDHQTLILVWRYITGPCLNTYYCAVSDILPSLVWEQPFWLTRAICEWARRALASLAATPVYRSSPSYMLGLGGHWLNV